MNRNQLFILSIFFWLLMFAFITIDSLYYNCFDLSSIDEPLDHYDVWCIISGEVYDPFIYLFAGLGIVFFVLGLMQSKNIEDDAPKNLKDLVKLSRLEHEVKKLKKKIK